MTRISDLLSRLYYGGQPHAPAGDPPREPARFQQLLGERLAAGSAPVAAAAWEPEVQGTAPGGEPSAYNPKHFATAETAAHYAARLGGEVKELGLEGFTRSAPERLIVAGHAELNAGLVADLYQKYPEALADQMIADMIRIANGPPAGGGEVSST